MRKFFLASAAALMASCGVASAVPITGSSMISFADGIRYDNTSLTFLQGGVPAASGNANIAQNTATGSFSPTFSAGCTGCATFVSTTYRPFTASGTPFYTATLGGATMSFTLDTLAVTSTTALSLTLEGAGTLMLTGFDPTPGILLFSTQGPQGANVSFSATSIANSTAVPEPASLALLGAGLLGLGIIRRKSS